MRFFVLGGYGIIGKAVVRDLFDYSSGEIIIAGRDIEKAKEYAASFKSNRVKSIFADVENINNLAGLIRSSDVVVNCVQYYYNLNVMKACLKAKTNYVDLGGLFHETKKQLKLNNDFKKIGKTAILGIGAAPGIVNVMAAYASIFLDKIESIDIVFADKDETKYKQKFVLPYSFKTIIDEYTKKPAVFRNGKTIFVEAGSGIKEYYFQGIGKVKGFYSLHSEIATLPDYFKAKGIKKCEFRVSFLDDFNKKINDLIELGFSSGEKLKFKDKEIKITDMSSKIMDRLLPEKGIKIIDSEILRVDVNDGEIIMEAIAKSDGKTSAGVLDTGIPCSIAAQMIEQINETGVLSPEKAINSSLFFRELRKRGIKAIKNGKEVR